MLWWFIGVWLASGAVLPVCWLLSIAYRAASNKMGPKGLYALSGLVGIGALILLFLSPFRDSNITMRDMPSASAVVQAPMMSAAEAKPIQTEPALLGEAEQVASTQLRIHIVGESANDDVSRQDVAAPQVPAAGALLTVPAYPNVPSAGRGSAHRRTPEPPVGPYVTQSNHGTWLFPPNQTGVGG